MFLAVVIPAVIKLFLLDTVRSFEAHDMALEWIRSGQFRYPYMGAWNYTFQFPVYTGIVSLIYLLGFGKYAVLVFQVVCGTVTAYLAGRTALVLFHGKEYGRSVGCTVVILTGLSPFLAYYQTRVLHPFAWDMLLAMALLLASLTCRADLPKQFIGLFALAGLATLNRPTLIVFLVPFLWRERGDLLTLRGVWWRSMAMAMLALPLGAWACRCFLVTGEWELNSVTDQMVWMGIQEATEGGGQLPNGDNYLHLLSIPEREQLLSSNARGQGSFFRTKWHKELAARPWLWLKMYVIKLKNFWLFRSHLGLDHPIARMDLVASCYRIYAGTMLVLIVATVRLRNRGLNLVLFPVILLSMAQSLFYFETRHRLLVEPMLMTIGLGVIAEIHARSARKKLPLVPGVLRVGTPE